MISFMALYMCQVLHIVDFLGSRRMETAPTSIEVLLRPTQSQSDKPSTYKPGATSLNFSDRADIDERTLYPVYEI